MSGPLIAGLALVVALALTPVVMVVARHLGVVDRPGALKPQTVPVPYLGGVAVFAAVVVGAAAGRPSVLLPLGMALGLGVADDRVDLPAPIRLIGQLAIGGAVVATCPVRLDGTIAAILILALTVLMINGVNLIDGLDMLAGGVVAVAAVGFAVALHGAGRQLGIALAAGLAGFLYYNRPPARVYLGDGGSYLLGAALAVLVAEAWAPGVAAPVGIAVLALVAVPVAEVACAMVRRFRGRRSLLAGDRRHPYDRLVARGWSAPAASLTYIGCEALLTVGALVAVHLASMTAAVVLDVAAAVLLVASGAGAGALTPDEEATK